MKYHSTVSLNSEQYQVEPITGQPSILLDSGVHEATESILPPRPKRKARKGRKSKTYYAVQDGMKALPRAERKRLWTIAKHIQSVTSDITWGWKGEHDDHHVWANLKSTILTKTNTYGQHLWKLPLWMILANLLGIEKVFGTGGWRREQEVIWFSIDTDIQKSQKKGTRDGVAAWNEFLRTKFPGIVVEPSTNGDGSHAHVLVRRAGHSNEDIKTAIRAFGEYLATVAQDFEIECVEVKGILPQLSWQDKKLVEINCGVLCRLPKTDISKTVVFGVEELLCTVVQVAKEKPAPATMSGSCLPVPKTYLDKWPVYTRTADYLLAEFDFAKAGREVVTTDKLAGVLLLLDFCSSKKYRNSDDAMPHRRFQVLWTILHKTVVDGEPFFKTAFSNKAWASVIRKLIDIGLVQEIDRHYSTDKCARWTTSARFSALVQQFAVAVDLDKEIEAVPLQPSCTTTTFFAVTEPQHEGKYWRLTWVPPTFDGSHGDKWYRWAMEELSTLL
jgi:hypothetical protein